MKHSAILLPAILLILSSCGNRKSSTSSQNSSDTPAISSSTFATDSILWADSLTTGNAKANVTLSVAYPVSGNRKLVDSISSWILRLLPNPDSFKSDKASSSENAPAGLPLSINAKTIADAGQSLLEIARTDFAGFDTLSMDYPIRYEWNYDIRPVYLTDSVITYNSMRYVYLAGAHGSTLADTQTFRLSDGLPLTAANILDPDSIPALTNLLRRNLYTRYFLPQLSESAFIPTGDRDTAANAPADPANTPGSTSTDNGNTPGSSSTSALTDSQIIAALRECLLINPDTLPLPVNPPYFTADGINFCYQQYEIAPYAAGMPTVTLPYATIRPLLSPIALPLLPR